MMTTRTAVATVALALAAVALVWLVWVTTVSPVLAGGAPGPVPAEVIGTGACSRLVDGVWIDGTPGLDDNGRAVCILPSLGIAR